MYISELYGRLFVFTKEGQQFAGPFADRQQAQDWINLVCKWKEITIRCHH